MPLEVANPGWLAWHVLGVHSDYNKGQFAVQTAGVRVSERHERRVLSVR